MTTIIAAKPTIYKGVQYRSRLEATWAVFLDHLGVEFSYEDSHNSLWNEEYTPDFKIELAGAVYEFIEVKPVHPNEQYMIKLRREAARVGMYRYHLLLACGSFRDDSISLSEFPYNRPSYSLLWYCARIIKFDAHPAFSAAQNFRWDLYEDGK